LLEAWCNWHLGFVHLALGEFTMSREHLEQVVAFYVPAEHHHALLRLPGAEAGVSAMAYLACCLWCLGYPEQAAEQSRRALTLARDQDHAFTLADVLSYGGCVLNVMRRDAQALKGTAEQLVCLTTERSVPGWASVATCHQGTAVAMLAQATEGVPGAVPEELADGISQIRAGIVAHRTAGKGCYVPGALFSLGEAQARAGQPEEGLATVAEALASVEETDERHYEAELYRLRAEVLLEQGKEAEAEASLHKAIEVARRQSAKSWELRATTALSRLWQRRGKREQARRRLADVYLWFSEGFDTTDLQEAKALLEKLS
jgi:predicted ATPase